MDNQNSNNKQANKGVSQTPPNYYKNNQGGGLRIQISQYDIPPGTVKPRHLAKTLTLAKGDIYYVDANGEFTKLAIGTAGQVLTVVDGVPAWA